VPPFRPDAGDTIRDTMASRSRRLPGAWLALLAALVLALAPTVSRALIETALPVEICSATGEAHGASSAPASGGESRGNVHFDACALCPIAASGIAPPALPAAVVATPVATRLAPARFPAAPDTHHAWSPAAPRGPPAGA
jgi:hypothetical protein